MAHNGAGILSGASGLYWDSTNSRLGIGTVTPTSTLHVTGTNARARISNMATLSLTSSDNGGVYNYIQSGDSSSTTGSWVGIVFGNLNRSINTSVPKLIIANDGNVGVNLVEPAEKLHVKGNIKIESGNVLMTDIINYTVNINVNPPVVLNQYGAGTITCTHEKWPNPEYTDCQCPTGYQMLSGGGRSAGVAQFIRETRMHTSGLGWRLGCSNGTSFVACGVMSIKCARILSN